ncbi:MAG TPA: hypothetical protein VGJ38_16720 [Jatrophihabitantaceae bacterium]
MEPMENMCAERIWRITPVTVDDNSLRPNDSSLMLLQENAFGSQDCFTSGICVQNEDCESGFCRRDNTCGPAPDGVLRTRFQPAANLVTGIGPTSFQSPALFTSMALVQAPTEVHDLIQLQALPRDESPQPFTGRGLYANYILLFPRNTGTCSHDAIGNPTQCPGWTEERMRTVKDVLIRFDIVHATVQHDPAALRQPIE